MRMAHLGNKRVRVCTYNVLSSALTQGHSLCQPEDLAEQPRLKKLCAKLDNEISKNSVICLQEVSQDWIGPLTAYFAQKDYHLTVAQYGTYWNNYMGVGTAFPMKEFQLVEAQFKKPVHSKKWPKAPQPGAVQKWMNWAMNWIKVWDWKKKPTPDAWDESYKRWNTMILEKLKCKDTGMEFCVGNYHNPCAFKTPVI